MGRLLDYFENKWPYTDFHELNADWLISNVKELITIIDEFVANNSIKYADPLEWNITSQYEKNTVVVDPATGIAYLSVNAVPSGVGIDNTNYWTPIFDLSALFDRFKLQIDDIKKAFTDNNEGENKTASKAYSVNDWLWIGNRLYTAIADMPAGTAFIVGTNVKLWNVETQTTVTYNANERTLYIHGKIDPDTPISVTGDYHVYNPTRQAIEIKKV